MCAALIDPTCQQLPCLARWLELQVPLAFSLFDLFFYFKTPLLHGYKHALLLTSIHGLMSQYSVIS